MSIIYKCIHSAYICEEKVRNTIEDYSQFKGFHAFVVSVRLILFCIIWVLTMGKHHFWLLPNLTEDVGFLESFRPLYKHESKIKDSSSGKEKPTKSSKKSSKGSSRVAVKEKDKSSDREESGSEQEEFEMIDSGDVEDGEEDGEDQENEESQGDVGEDGDHGEEEDYGPEEEEEEEEEQNGSAEGD